MRRRILHSAISLKQVKKFIIPSWVCRFLRSGRTLGVLVVQNKTRRTYREDEVEALETTAMLIAEIVASGELKKITRPGVELDLTRAVSIDGDAYGEGIGLGHVVLHDPRIVVTNLLNEDADMEITRLAEAIGSLRLSIDDMLQRRDVATEGEHREVLETYRMFAMIRAGCGAWKRPFGTA